MELFKSLDPQRIITFGVEISEPVCEAARRAGHSVFFGRFEDVELDRAFDIINLTHVIEHVSDPRAVVRKAFDALRPGGLLVVETPNIGSYEWPWFKSGNWGAYHIPRHWYFFDRRTLCTLCESEGFSLIEWRSHPAPTHWVWTMHNISLANEGLLASAGKRIFDPIRIFRGGIVPTIVLGLFHILDRTMIAMGKSTSVMTEVFRK